MERKECPLRQTIHNPESLTQRPALAEKTALHNLETLRVFVSDWPPERGCFGESRDRRTNLWRVVETREIAGKYVESRCFALLQDTGYFE